MNNPNNLILEQCLLQKLVLGDHFAFTSLYYNHASRLRMHIRRLVKSEEMISEIYQDVFSAVWESRTRIDPQQSFAAYIYRIAVNKIFDHSRRLTRQKKLITQLRITNVAYAGADCSLSYQKCFNLLENSIERLPPIRKKVYALSQIEGKSYVEIASMLRMSTSTVNDHVVKANQLLRTFIKMNKDIMDVIVS